MSVPVAAHVTKSLAARRAVELHREGMRGVPPGEAYAVVYSAWWEPYGYTVMLYDGHSDPMPARGDALAYDRRCVFVVGAQRVIRLPRVERLPVPWGVAREVLAA